SSIRSNGRSSSFCKPAAPVSASVTSKLSEVSNASRPSRISISSSTTRMDPLRMHRFPCYGEFQTEGSSLSRDGAHVYFSGLFFDDSIAHREAQSCAAAAGFCGKKRVEDSMQVLRRNASARIGHLDLHRTIVSAGSNFNHAPGRHGIASVH